MSEPNYEYVKGVGWQIVQDHDYIEVYCTWGKGQRFRIYHRPPKLGELGFCFGAGSRVGKMSFEERIEWFTSCHYPSVVYKHDCFTNITGHYIEYVE